jgi:hypothetical protein
MPHYTKPYCPEVHFLVDTMKDLFNTTRRYNLEFNGVSVEENESWKRKLGYDLYDTLVSLSCNIERIETAYCRANGIIEKDQEIHLCSGSIGGECWVFVKQLEGEEQCPHCFDKANAVPRELCVECRGDAPAAVVENARRIRKDHEDRMRLRQRLMKLREEAEQL